MKFVTNITTQNHTGISKTHCYGEPRSITLILVILLFVLFPFHGNSQNLRLIHADFHRSTRLENGKILKILEGHVHLIRDTLTIFADRIEFLEDEQVIHLIGSVRMQTPNKDVFSQKATYYPETDYLELFNNVKYIDSSRILRTENATIDLKRNYLRSPVAVNVLQLKDNSFVSSDSGAADTENNRYYFTGNAYFYKPDSSENDAKIWADKFEIYQREGDILFKAIDSVKIIRGQLNAKCQRADYYIDRGIIYLSGDPHAEWDLNEMISDTMIIFIDEETNQPQKFNLIDHAEVFSPLDSTRKRENYLSGRNIIAHFRDGEINWIEAIDNATSNYYIENEEESNSGMNHASADTIRMYLKEQEIDSVAIIGGIEGTYNPEN